MEDTNKIATTTTTETSIEESPQSMTSNMFDHNSVDSNETTNVVDQILCPEPNTHPRILSSSESDITVIDQSYLSESLSSSSLILGTSPTSSSTSLTLPTQMSADLPSTPSPNFNPAVQHQHPIFALPMNQQNPSQVIIPPLDKNGQSPAFMIPLPTIYVPIIPLNPWQMATLKSRVKHQLKLKRKASSSSTTTSSCSSCSSISHRLKISRKKLQKKARMSNSKDSMGEEQKDQENSTSSYFQENENDDEFLVVVDVDMSDDEEIDSTDEDENENDNGNGAENKDSSVTHPCHSSKINGGDGDHSPSSSSSFSLGHQRKSSSSSSSRNLLHQVKELSQQLLARLTDSEARLKNNSNSVQNIEIVENGNIQQKTENSNESSPNLLTAASTKTPENTSDATAGNSPVPVTISTAQSVSTVDVSPQSSSTVSNPPLENKDSNGNKPETAQGEAETEAEVDTEAEAEVETTEEDPEFEEEYEPVDPEETENQNQADEDDEEPEGESSTGQATTSNTNSRNQPDLFKGCLALSSEVVLSYGRISSLHEKLHAILYGEHHHVIIGGFLCGLSYTFKRFSPDYNNINNNSSNISNNFKGTSNDNNNSSNTNNNNNSNNDNRSSPSESTVNCNSSYHNINHSRYTGTETGGNNNNNVNTVANGYCVGFYLDDLDPNTFEMEIQDGRIKVAGRRDDIDLTLDIHIASPVHIEDIVVDHFKASNLLWLKIYF